MLVNCPVSIGELFDKLSILRVKLANIADEEKLTHVRKEEGELLKILEELKLLDCDGHLDDLFEINSKLWKIEDDIREEERSGEFGVEFIKLARAVYVVNDERFAKKSVINELYGSSIREVKSYKKY